MKHLGHRRFGRRPSLWVLLAGLLLASGAGVFAIVNPAELELVRQNHEGVAEHVEDDFFFQNLVRSGHGHEAFEQAFELGDELFEAKFNAVDGVGANVGDGSRFTRTPRADLRGSGQWAKHTPQRATGPNAQACNGCHFEPFDDGAGSPQGNVHRDPLHSARLEKFIQRNTPHVFAPGAPQVLAEEMTAELQALRDQAAHLACYYGSATRSLSTKGVSFGSIKAVRTSYYPCRVTYDTSNVRGVDGDLVVRPFQWKGSVASVRDFNRGAAHNELGMQAVELVGDDVDGDYDGVKNEMTVGDMTALAIYLAAQPRPTTKTELAELDLIEPLPPGEVSQINRGSYVFGAVGCDDCHVRQLKIDNPVFNEPSKNANFRDATFPAGQNPKNRGVDPRWPVSFDLTADQPDNPVPTPGGGTLGAFKRDGSGRAIVELFGDLRRHDMGSRLAEGIDEVGTGAATFLTENLWGVGSTAPYLHDGRATTLTEAILEHGGAAASSREAFVRRSTSDQQALIAFLDNLVLFKMEEEAGVVTASIVPKGVTLRTDRLQQFHRRK